MWTAIAVAVAVRVALLADKPFWRDEAWVALLVGDPWRAVTDSRAVPVGFLYLTRLAAAVPGLSPEVAYRVVPLVCGIVALPVLARFAVALGASHRVAVATTWIAVGLQPLVYYSRELKPYGIDFLLAVLLPLLAIRGFSMTAPQPGARRWLMAGVLVAPWMSFGAIFSVSALLAWGWVARWRQFSWALRRDWFLCSVAFTLSFAAVYAVTLADQSTDPRIHDYWAHRLLDSDWSAATKTAVATWRFASISALYLFSSWWPLFLALGAVGAWMWPPAGRGFLAWLYIVPAATCVAATVTDRYLLAQGRHLLFVAPMLLLWLAGGLEAVARRATGARGDRLTMLTLAVPVVLSAFWCVQAIEHRTSFYRTNWADLFRYDVLQDVDVAIDKASGLVPAGEPLLVTDKSAYAFQFYAHGRLPQATYCARHCPDFRRLAERWLRHVRGRAWILMVDEDVHFLSKLLAKRGFGVHVAVQERATMVLAVERRDPRGDKSATRWTRNRSARSAH